MLYLRPGPREHFLESLAKHWPELLPRYLDLYAGRAYLPDFQVRPVQKEVRRLGDALGVGARPERFLEPAAQPQQLSLLA